MTELNIDHLIRDKGREKKAVIPILQVIQNTFNYLPENILREVCERTEITPDLIVGVASFYTQFRLEPAGEHIIKVCTGTACHVKGAGLVYDAYRRYLDLPDGKLTDKDGKYSLEKVNCLGCCTLAPVVQIDDTTYGHVGIEQVEEVVDAFERDLLNPAKRASGEGDKQVGQQGEIRIGLGSCCVASGSEEVKKSLEKAVISNGLDVNMKKVGCVGMCHQVPLLELIPSGKEPVLYSHVQPADVNAIIKKHFYKTIFNIHYI